MTKVFYVRYFCNGNDRAQFGRDVCEMIFKKLYSTDDDKKLLRSRPGKC